MADRARRSRPEPGPHRLALAVLVALLLPGGGRATAGPASPCAEASTTLAMTECLVGEVRRADAEVERYLAHARERLERERREPGLTPPQPGERPTDLAATQRLWLAYRRSHCGDVAARWRGASLRPVVTAECLLRLSRARSRELWRAYLTFPDGTAPVLPDPDAPPPPVPSSGPKR